MVGGLNGGWMNALERLNRKSIRVTDLASQYWCERQMELRYLYGDKVTKEEKQGRKIHEMLESETNVPVLLEPKSYADYVYKMLYTDHMALGALAQNKRTREFQIFGLMDGFNLAGKIDELRIRDGKLLIVEDKTRQSNEVPGESQMLPHKIQIMFYRDMLSALRSGAYTMQRFSEFYGTDRLSLTPEFMRQLQASKVPYDMCDMKKLEHMVFSQIRMLPEISGSLYIRYRNQFTGDVIKLYKFAYDEKDVQGAKDYLLPYWKGDREAMPVPKEEAWKCNWCVFFGKQCKVWWKQQALKQ